MSVCSLLNPTQSSFTEDTTYKTAIALLEKSGITPVGPLRITSFATGNRFDDYAELSHPNYSQLVGFKFRTNQVIN